MSATAANTGRTVLPADVAERKSGWILLALEWALLLLGIGFYAHTVVPRAWARVNTDFPNYYVSARLVREGYATERIYEWGWFSRQKDRMTIDQPLADFIPHTPFSALVMVPLSRLDALTAKRAWIVINLAMLAIVIAMLSSITRLSWRWVTIAALFSVPLYRNFEYGQLYLLLLLLLVGALCTYLQGHKAIAGALIAFAAGLKIFPIFFVLYFARKRDWAALGGFLAGCAAVVLACVVTFSHTLLATFAAQILPSALRGEGNDPYNLSANSISALLHHLFIYEPQLNLHPLVHAPALMAVLQPLLQALVLTPVLLLCAPGTDRERVQLEWGALVVAMLAASTMPASYHFVLLLLPLSVWASHHAGLRQWWALGAWAALYVAIGWPKWPSFPTGGMWALLTVPRLWSVLLLVVFCWRGMRKSRDPIPGREWIAIMAVLATIQMGVMLRHVDGLYDTQAWQVDLPQEIFSAEAPTFDGDELRFSAMTLQGWRLASSDREGHVRFEPATVDELAAAYQGSDGYVEQDAATSAISLQRSSADLHVLVPNAQKPIISRDGSLLAFIRESKGRGALLTRPSSSGVENRITPGDLDVYDASFDPEQNLVFAAADSDGLALYRADGSGVIRPLGIPGARSPVVSPDGRWLAYSKLSQGTWHLTVRDLATNADRRIGTADCNDWSSAWQSDSKTLVYASDCGRGLWETALYVRRVIP